LKIELVNSFRFRLSFLQKQESRIFSRVLWIPVFTGMTRLGYFFKELRRYQISILFFHLFCITLLLLTAFYILPPTTYANEKWPGVDESVVEKYAEEHGREASEPLINTDQGDLLLFVFLLAGAVGGFIGGYYWRTLTEKRTTKVEILKKNI
jgi:cobalt/nickel transport protein